MAKMTEKEIKSRLQYYIGDDNYSVDEKVDMCFEEFKRLNKKGNIPIEILIDALPQNQPLYKDSGSWQIRSDDMEEVIFQQECNEDFRTFIERYVSEMLQDDFDVQFAIGLCRTNQQEP